MFRADLELVRPLLSSFSLSQKRPLNGLRVRSASQWFIFGNECGPFVAITAVQLLLGHVVTRLLTETCCTHGWSVGAWSEE